MECTTIDTTAAIEARPAFTCDPRALGDAVKFLAMRVIERRNTYPILSTIRFNLDPAGTVTLQGTDLDVQATVTIPATVEAPGAFCIDAHVLKDMLAKLRKVDRDALRIEWPEPCRAVLVMAHNRFNLPALPADDFPTLDSPTVGKAGPLPLSRFTVPAARFVADLAALAPCISTEEHRYYLNGIAMQVREMAGRDRLVMVATDGYQIGVASRALPAGAERLGDCILPRKAVALIGHVAKLATPTEGIEIAKASRFAIRIGNVEIIAKEIDGTFPDWERCFDEALAPTDYSEPVLFPDLLPGVPVAAMEKLAKVAGSPVQWENTYQGRLGSVASDPDILFGAFVDPRNSEAPKGYSYADEGLTFTVDGDSTVYPVATKGGRMILSAGQISEIVGESAFETMEIVRADSSTAFILKWLWDDGASRFLAVRKDGRCFDAKHGGQGALIERAEIEAVMAGEIEAPASAPEKPQERVETVDATPAAPEPVSCSDEAPVAVDIYVNNSGPVAEPVTVESCDTLDTQGDCMAAFIETLDTLPAVSAPTMGKRTPAHEWAIRRAWAERKAARLQRAIADEHMRMREQVQEHGRWADAQLRKVQGALQRRGFEMDGLKAKRRRAVLLALSIREGRKIARDSAAERLVELIDTRAELTQARQAPTYFDDTGMERRDAAAVAFDQGRHALDKAESLGRTVEGAKAVAIRQQRAIETLADELEAMTARALKAERALAAVQARQNGWPPAVRKVDVNFAMAG